MLKKEGSIFFKIIAVIGAVLILVGIAWLIAMNWREIPDFLKVLILVISTVLAFGVGVLARIKEHEAPARALILLGAGLYLLSLVLIAQIYHLATSGQHYAWIIFLAWTVIMFTAYLLKSPENLIFSMFLFGLWIFVQYIVLFEGTGLVDDSGITMAVALILLSLGVMLYGSSIFHNSIKHQFTNVYRFWSVFYFLALFYILSFQTFIPVIGNYTFDSAAFNFFLIAIVFISFLGLLLSILFAASKQVISIKEILAFVGIICLLFVLVLVAKPASGDLGVCSSKNCYEFNTQTDCTSAPGILSCVWDSSSGRVLAVPDGEPAMVGSCQPFSCYNLQSESECNAAPQKQACVWKNGGCRVFDCNELQESNCTSDSRCQWDRGNCFMDREIDSVYAVCNQYDNQKPECLDQEACKWRVSSSVLRKADLPLSLWLFWIVTNILFIGFIILILGYGQLIGSTNIINLGLAAFILEIITRYIGFWMDLQGYVAFSFLAILGGIILIAGSWLIPKWWKNLRAGVSQEE
ncbi:MAG: DUF2157 domain-containing protein [archaeon]